MKKIIITGATSFLALNLIEKLSKLNCKIYAVIRQNSLKKDKLKDFKNIDIIELNMDNIEELPNYIHENCDTFYHFAWNGTRGSDRDNEQMQQNNIAMSINALKAAKNLGCKTFFTAGSQAEYGTMLKQTTENDKCNPTSEYGKAKLKFYLEAKKYCDSQNIRLFEPRFFSVYGRGDYENTLIMQTLNKLIKNETVELSSGFQLWNYIYVKDAVEILIELDNSKINGGGIFNIASNDTRKLKSFIIEMKNNLNSNSSLKFNDDNNNGINPNIDKLKKLLNYQFKYKFIDGIKDMLD